MAPVGLMVLGTFTLICAGSFGFVLCESRNVSRCRACTGAGIARALAECGAMRDHSHDYFMARCGLVRNGYGLDV